jgi:hypothetical protein
LVIRLSEVMAVDLFEAECCPEHRPVKILARIVPSVAKSKCIT